VSGWLIVLASLGFLALCVACDAWWLNSARNYGDSNGTHP